MDSISGDLGLCVQEFQRQSEQNLSWMKVRPNDACPDSGDRTPADGPCRISVIVLRNFPSYIVMPVETSSVNASPDVLHKSSASRLRENWLTSKSRLLAAPLCWC